MLRTRHPGGAAYFSTRLPCRKAPASGCAAPKSGRRDFILSAAAIGMSSVVAAASGTPAAGASPFGIPRADLAPNLSISRVIKGCWQLSGGHGGDRSTDRTGGAAAVAGHSQCVSTTTRYDEIDLRDW